LIFPSRIKDCCCSLSRSDAIKERGMRKTHNSDILNLIVFFD
jgi:hypothetical protein